MVKEARAEYDTCLSSAKDYLPTTPSFLKACQDEATTIAVEETEEAANEA